MNSEVEPAAGDQQAHEGGALTTRLPRGDLIGATLYELPAGAPGPAYHFHHGAEELLVVLAGNPTLRTPDGEKSLSPGDVVHFVRGAEGAHKCSNPTSAPVKYLMISNQVSVEAVEYPDSQHLSIQAKTDDQYGRRLWDIRPLLP